MTIEFFQNIESAADKTAFELKQVIDNLAFNDQGLISVITQDASTKDVLMFAWMNKEALELTLETRRVTYWSRSRKKLWIKGESSGNTQTLVSLSFDCDGDCILCLVQQTGPACHTGRPNCFYLKTDAEHGKVIIQGDMPQ